MKVLTVYYSRTGITAKIARMIHDELGGDLEEIKDTRSRSGAFNYLRSGMEAALKMQAKIQAAGHDPGAYDLVVIGTPVWSHTMSTPVRAYLEQYKTSFKACAFFATCGSTGVSKTLGDMETLSGLRGKALLDINKRDHRSGAFREKVKRFAGSLMETVKEGIE